MIRRWATFLIAFIGLAWLLGQCAVTPEDSARYQREMQQAKALHAR
ncbi:hypothetical protein [Sphingobium sp. LSP13-1-1.1]